MSCKATQRGSRVDQEAAGATGNMWARVFIEVFVGRDG